MLKSETEFAYFGGGCFWCLEAVFSRTKGIKLAEPGYAGGKTEKPDYEKVSAGNTGHAETVRIEFFPEEISYKTLLNIFFSIHDPTTKDKQGYDAGSQYRSVIFYENDEQREIAEKTVKELEEKKVFDNPIVTEIVLLDKFYPAEEYHRDYFAKHPEKAYCQAVILPKVAKLREKFTKYYRQ